MNTNLLKTAIHQVVAMVDENSYKELIDLANTDNNFRDSLLGIEKLVNWVRRDTFSQEFLFSLSQNKLSALIKTFTALDGAVDKFTFGAETPVPCLFHKLSDNDYQHFDELVDWVFKNRKNKHILPFGWEAFEANSLREYSLLGSLKKLKSEELIIQNNITSIHNQLKNPHKATYDLLDAINRKDINAFGRLIEKGAETYYRDVDGKTLAEKIRELNNYISVNGGIIEKSKLFEHIHLVDAHGKGLTIDICDFEITDTLSRFDCVSLSARYDHGFGFSKLYRFVEDRESEEIKSICDSVNETKEARVLPQNASLRWRVILTPIVKTNTEQKVEQYKAIMNDVITIAKSIEVKALLLSQYGLMFNYKNYQVLGICEALQELKQSGFGEIKHICFEVDSRYKKIFISQLRNSLITR